jgi:hypothetical protein
MLFSQRKGIKPIKSVMQVDSMDDDLRTALWNALHVNYWKEWDAALRYDISIFPKLDTYTQLLWHGLFKKPIDSRSDVWHRTLEYIRKHFFASSWAEVYDFIEFTAINYPDDKVNDEFINTCNAVLKQELSAYRFVGNTLAQITSEEEISEIEEALSASQPLKTVSSHLHRSLELLGDRKSPDYRNSIKESISAVEALCSLIAGNKATLGQAIKTVESKVNLHPALKGAFSSLYGYTSDASGIRHALMEESNLDFEDAKFMLVSCSAFINYLLAKATKAGVTL